MVKLGRTSFMPKGVLEAKLTPTRIEMELQHLPSLHTYNGSARQCAEEICGLYRGKEESCRNNDHPPKSYRMIFAILIHLGRTDSIFSFLAEKVGDDDLPLHKSDEAGQQNDYLLFRKRDSAKSKPLNCFSGWRPRLRYKFWSEQWGMLATYFTRDEKNDKIQNYHLTEEDILPFTYDSRHDTDPNGLQTVSSGGFGLVFKVKIHPAHHAFPSRVSEQMPRRSRDSSPR